MIHEIGQGVFSNAFSLAEPKNGEHIFCFRGDDILVSNAADVPSLPVFGEIAPKCHHLFSMRGSGCFLADEDVEPAQGFSYTHAPTLARSHPSREVGFAVITALQLHQWERTRRFCGHCGAKTVRGDTERSMVCPECGNIEYPKICPAVIMAVEHEGKLLMARHNRSGRFALLAGFVEIGETFEEAVKREVMEEVGLPVTDVKYFANQPWGFSSSQMIGFTARLDGDHDIPKVQESELSEAQWFAPQDVPRPASDISISAELIWNFIRTH